MSPRKKVICATAPRFTTVAKHQDLNEKRDSACVGCSPEDGQGSNRNKKSRSQKIDLERVEKNIMKNVSVGQATKAKMDSTRKAKFNVITKASELVETKEPNKKNNNLKVYTVYSKGDLMQKMGNVQPKPFSQIEPGPPCTAPAPSDEPEPMEMTVDSTTPQFPSTDVFKEIWRESMVWKYFNNVQGGATCRVCGRILKISRRGTLSLEHHLFIRHRQEYEVFQKDCTDGIGGVTTTMKGPIKTYSRVRKPLQMLGMGPDPPTAQTASKDLVLPVVPDPQHKLDLTGPQQLCIVKRERRSKRRGKDDEEEEEEGDEEGGGGGRGMEKQQQSSNTVLVDTLEGLVGIREELIDIYNFGTFKKKSTFVLDDSSTGTNAETAKTAQFRPKAKFPPFGKSKEYATIHKMKTAQTEGSSKPLAVNDHAYAVVGRKNEPYVPVKQEREENLDLIVPDTVSQEVNVIVPDSLSVPEYPRWLKREPENVVELECKEAATLEQSSSHQNLLVTQTIKDEPNEEEILG